MAYKDKEKQKQANKEAAQRRRDKVKGMTPAGYDSQGMTGLTAYDIVPDVKVYSRSAVVYAGLREAWQCRPEPLSPDDKPKPLNRGKYIRPDGSEYIFDACGKVFECVWDEALQQAVVYKTLAEVLGKDEPNHIGCACTQDIGHAVGQAPAFIELTGTPLYKA